MMRREHWVAAVAALAVLAPSAAPAQVSFRKYVAVGDSLTAGYASGGLVADHQAYSYPALLADRFGSEQPFEQPWISDPGIPTLLVLHSLVPGVVLDQDHDGDGTADPPGSPLNLFLPRPYDNLGIPGAAVRHTVHPPPPPGDPDRPFFYDLVIRGDLIPDGTEDTVVQQVAALQPTFVTIWIGANDILGAALSGCDGSVASLDPNWFCPITPSEAFDADFQLLVDSIDATGASLAIANLPDVTAIPFVQFMPETGPNGEDLYSIDRQSGQPEKVLAADFVLPAARCYLEQGCGFGVPPTLLGAPSDLVQGCEGPPGAPEPFTWDCSAGAMPTNAVLRAFEAQTLQARIADYNATIEAKAAEVGAALVDAHGYFERVATEGIVIGGIHYDAGFLSGGLFSYDGVHPSKLGYALVANLFIESINNHFGTSIPLVDLYPFVFGGLAPPQLPAPPTAASLPGGALAVLAGGPARLGPPAAVRRIERSLRVERLRLEHGSEHPRRRGPRAGRPRLPRTRR